MKLVVKLMGSVEQTKEVVIRNPVATLQNVRAAIAVHFCLDPHSFRMLHATANLENESITLVTSGVSDCDTITIVAKRPRDGSTVREGDGAPSTRESGATTVAAGLGMRPTDGGNGSINLSDRPSNFTMSSVSALQSARETRETNVRTTLPHVMRPRDTDEVVAMEMERAAINRNTTEGDDWIDEESEEESGEEGDIEPDGPEAEQRELTQLLLELPDVLSLREQFLANPQGMLEQMQRTNPRLFQLISRHSQFFLELLQNDDLIAALQEEEEGSFDEGDEEEDDDNGDAHDAIMASAIQASLGHNRAAGGGGGTGVGNRGSTGQTVREPRTPDEVAKVDTLLQLGFTRDRVLAALAQAHWSVDRAANILFDSPSYL